MKFKVIKRVATNPPAAAQGSWAMGGGIEEITDTVDAALYAIKENGTLVFWKCPPATHSNMLVTYAKGSWDKVEQEEDTDANKPSPDHFVACNVPPREMAASFGERSKDGDC